MSNDLHLVRLVWDGRHGIAKSGGVSVELLRPPALPGVVRISEIDYAPFVRLQQIRESAGLWRVMRPSEIASADAMLARMCAAAHGALTETAK